MQVMVTQPEGGDFSEKRSGDARARFNACLKCHDIGHFHRDCLKFNAQAQSGDNVDTIIGQITHILSANSPVTDMVLKSILKELISAKVAKKNHKQKYQQAKASVASAAAATVTASDAIVTNPTPAICTINM